MDVVQDTEMWIKFAQQELEQDPAADLHDYTHINYMSEFRGWSFGVNQIYTQAPTTPERSYLRREVFKILLIALENAFRRAETKDYSGEIGLFEIMDVSEAYRVGRMVVLFDPCKAAQIKIRLNQICLLTGSSLDFLEEKGFYHLCMPDKIW